MIYLSFSVKGYKYLNKLISAYKNNGVIFLKNNVHAHNPFKML